MTKNDKVLPLENNVHSTAHCLYTNLKKKTKLKVTAWDIFFGKYGYHYLQHDNR